MNEEKANSESEKLLDKRLLSTKELSAYIGLAEQTIKNMFYAGRFPIPATRLCKKLLWDKRVVDRSLDRLPKDNRTRETG